jgi:hypothetical protein
VVTCPDATKCSKIFWVSFTDAEMSNSIDHLDARSIRPDAVLFWEELRYSRKAVEVDHPDEGKLSSEHSTARVQICLELGFLKLIYKWLYAGNL